MDDPTPQAPLCAAPFAALSIAANGAVSPCCEFEGHIGTLAENSLTEIWQGDKMADLRAAMARGEKPKACWKCWQQEEIGSKSLRGSMNLRFGPRVDASPKRPPPLPHYLDIRFSNLCNFKCRTCHHGASSKWFSDAKALGQESAGQALLAAFGNAKTAIAQFEEIGENVTDLYFAGGEPLLEKQHFELLRHLIKQKRTNIRLTYNTNLSNLDFEGSDIVKLWRQFDYLCVAASIDATGAAGALIRSGFDWAGFRANLARLRNECPDVFIHIGVTVSVFNLLRLPELHMAMVEEGIEPDSVYFHPVQMPRYYDIAILPKDIKEHAMVQIGAHVAELKANNPKSQAARQLEQIITRLSGQSITADAATGYRQKFREVTAQLDVLRVENTLETLPELASLVGGGLDDQA